MIGETNTVRLTSSIKVKLLGTVTLTSPEPLKTYLPMLTTDLRRKGRKKVSILSN